MKHVIQPGETLTSISLKYDVTIRELQSVNRILNADAIWAGQTLMIPDDEGQAPRHKTIAKIKKALISATPLKPIPASRSAPVAARWRGWSWCFRQPDGKYHSGQDYGANPGDPVFAVSSGKIRFAGFLPGGYGHTIIVELPDKRCQRYAHLRSTELAYKGKQVTQGELIGHVGRYVNRKGKEINHLHFDEAYAGVLQANPNEFSAFKYVADTKERYAPV